MIALCIRVIWKSHPLFIYIVYVGSKTMLFLVIVLRCYGDWAPWYDIIWVGNWVEIINSYI